MPSSTFNKYRLKGAYHYDWYENESWYRKLIDKAVDFCRGSTLDVGCGDGLLLSKLPKGSVGVDPDGDAIQLCLERGLSAIQGNAGQYDIGSFDYMACLNVIEHLNEPEVLHRIIRENVIRGAIISTIDYQGGSLGEDHKKEYTMDKLMEFFKKYDPKPFRIEDIWIGVEIRK